MESFNNTKLTLLENMFKRNSNWQTFGLDVEMKNETKIDEALSKIEAEFDLIMITEYFYESLILMKEDLNLDLDDVTSFAKNVAPHSGQKSTEFKRKIHEWQDLDSRLYRHFYQVLWRRIEKFGVERMKNQVQKLKNRNLALTSECVAEQNVDVRQLELKYRDWIPRNVTIRGNRLKQDPPQHW